MARGPVGRGLWVATLCLLPLSGFAADLPLVVQSCGKPIPVELGDPAKFKAEGIDIGQFQRNEVATYLKLIEAICKSEAKYRDLADQNVARILAVSESGAVTPTAYLDGTTLVIEFAGGKFDTKQATEELRRAIAGLPPDDAD